jgi:Leucine-rich repeat (LRR) protein
MTENDKHPKPKRRWLRFSLRTFLIVLTVFCVCFGWYLYRVERQREAVKWVRANGGWVRYEYEFDKDFVDGSQRSVPKWMLDMLGDDYFYTVCLVECSNTELNDLTPLAPLKNLKFLYLHQTQVNDLTPLAGLSNLEILFLWDTQVNDLTPLAGLTNLDKLRLYETQASDVDIETLKQALPNCNISIEYVFPHD